jgi:hypothetical protein
MSALASGVDSTTTEPTGDGSAAEAGATSPSTGADANACRPGDVGTYQPAAYHPASAAWQGVCRPDLISGFYDSCLGPQATASACAAFKSDKTAARCAECILTSDGASHYGPLVDHGISPSDQFITTNVAGCIELTDLNGLPCAKALQALGGCELAACEANCPVDDSASRVLYDTCAGQADQAGCQSYVALAACAGAEADAGLAASCLIGTFADFYAAVAPLFCGAPQVDGAVAPFDASADAAFAWPSDGATPVGADAHASASGDAQPDSSDAARE